jgi:hypothetical protein
MRSSVDFPQPEGPTKRAHEDDELAVLDFQIDAADHLHRAEALHHALQFEARHHATSFFASGSQPA